MVVTLVLLATMAGAAALGAWAMQDRVVAQWSCTWRGRPIRLVARQNTQVLYVDGVEVARKTTLQGSGASLSWAVESEGEEVRLVATVVHRGGGAVVGAISADGQWIGGSERADGAPGRSVPADPRVQAAEPIHPRWAPAKVLLADLASASDPRQVEAAQRIEAGLRDVLGRLRRIDEAEEAHRALGGQAAPIVEARARLEAQADALLDALRAFHVLAVGQADGAVAERLDELLARVAADAELEAPPRPVRPRLTEG